MAWSEDSPAVPIAVGGGWIELGVCATTGATRMEAVTMVKWFIVFTDAENHRGRPRATEAKRNIKADGC